MDRLVKGVYVQKPGPIPLPYSPILPSSSYTVSPYPLLSLLIRCMPALDNSSTALCTNRLTWFCGNLSLFVVV